MRNRIIAVVVLIVAIVLLFNLVSCAVRGISGAFSRPDAQSGSGQAGISLVQRANELAGARMQEQAAQAKAGVESPWTPGKLFATGDEELDKTIKDFCDSHASSEKSREENALSVYCDAIWYEYKERDDNQEPRGADWTIQYAKQLFANESCNCYEQAAAGAYILRYFGFEDAQAQPTLVLRQSGEYGDHGLVFVTNTDGRYCLCDPALGTDGWMLDADSYTLILLDIGQDKSTINPDLFEYEQAARWINA